MIHERFLERFESEWLGLVREHHSVHGSTATGRITASSPREGFVGDDPEAGLFVHPTLVDGVRVDDDLANTETFGPLVGVASFGDWEEAMALANGHGYGLSASIYTTSPQNAFRYRERISAGMVSVNNSTSGAEAHLPFGGNGKSGNGSRQSGMWVHRPVHALAVAQLGLRRQAAEGPDGRRRHRRRPRLPPRRVADWSALAAGRRVLRRLRRRAGGPRALDRRAGPSRSPAPRWSPPTTPSARSPCTPWPAAAWPSCSSP